MEQQSFSEVMNGAVEPLKQKSIKGKKAGKEILQQQ